MLLEAGLGRHQSCSSESPSALLRIFFAYSPS
jgi:hypothetical protein